MALVAWRLNNNTTLYTGELKLKKEKSCKPQAPSSKLDSLSQR